MIVNAPYLSFVVNTDIQFATAGIGEAAYPLQVFVTLVGFVFYVLGFGHFVIKSAIKISKFF